MVWWTNHNGSLGRPDLLHKFPCFLWESNLFGEEFTPLFSLLFLFQLVLFKCPLCTFHLNQMLVFGRSESLLFLLLQMALTVQNLFETQVCLRCGVFGSGRFLLLSLQRLITGGFRHFKLELIKLWHDRFRYCRHRGIWVKPRWLVIDFFSSNLFFWSLKI